ncbi:dihydropteroate synthase [Neorhizobium huautlense]|uniref:Dihydropteroate synthase n=1 Tax=Neorhizobium huautlense TaxID=67774 RepID=A0ABT9Q0C5_9HYPH|nr:dihydropteroate synthase [Neorhizobium huautlense]MDP9839424.1 dihydropteroate synthase [Neorhizobium huautlense]
MTVSLLGNSVSGNGVWQVGFGRSLDLAARGHLMAIVNVTPDSFSDGGRHDNLEAAVAHAKVCIAEGATIIDIGGESTRPGAEPVSEAEEQRRVLPVIERLAAETDVLISIDTYRGATARAAMKAGAHIINDVYGLSHDPSIADIAAETGAGLCIMHTGRGREAEKLADVIEDQFLFFKKALEIADAAGVDRQKIMLDPGFGFAKSREDEAELMARFGELHALNLPFLIGTSRKRFIGAMTGRECADERDVGTAATTAVLRLAGAHVFRVHNVAANRDALRVADAIRAADAILSADTAGSRDSAETKS